MGGGDNARASLLVVAELDRVVFDTLPVIALLFFLLSVL